MVFAMKDRIRGRISLKVLLLSRMLGFYEPQVPSGRFQTERFLASTVACLVSKKKIKMTDCTLICSLLTFFSFERKNHDLQIDETIKREGRQHQDLKSVQIIRSLALTFINIDIKSSNTHQALLVVTN